MKITIVQDPPENPADPFTIVPPAAVTVDLDDGVRISFTCQASSVLDPNGGGSEGDLSALGFFAREGGSFTATFDRVRDVELSHPAPER